MVDRESSNSTERVLVSGAGGFVGSALTASLNQRGSEVVAVERPSVTVEGVIGRIALGPDTAAFVDAIVELEPSCVLHVAAVGGAGHTPAGVDAMVDANVRLTAALLEAAAAVQEAAGHVVPVVAFGSFWQDSVAGHGYTPNSLYAATKQAALDIAAYYRLHRDIEFVQLRPWDIYGPDPAGRRFLQLVADAVATGEPLDATAGDQMASFVHVDDVVGAVHAAVDLVRSGEDRAVSYDIRADDPAPLRLVVEEMLASVGMLADIHWGARAYRAEEVMNPATGPTIPGWDPKVPLGEGFKRLVDRAHD